MGCRRLSCQAASDSTRESFLKNKTFAVGLLSAAFMVIPSLAAADYVKYRVRAAPGKFGGFDSLAALIADHNDKYGSAKRCPDFFYYSVYSSPTQWGPLTYFGEPKYYQAHWDEYECSTGTLSRSGQTSLTDHSFGCPAVKFPILAVSWIQNMVGSDDQGVCEIVLDKPVRKSPKECSKGDPVFTSNGSQSEVEEDYRDSGKLSHRRIYSSASPLKPRGFFAIEDVTRGLAIDGQTGLENSLSCLTFFPELPSLVEPACFPFQSSAGSKSTVDVIDEKGERSTFTRNADGTYGKEAGSQMTLSLRVAPDGSDQWLVRSPGAARFEIYSSNSALDKLVWQTGETVQVQYSSSVSLGIDGPDRPVPTSRSDQFGRVAQYAYDSQGRLKTFIGPDGLTTSYGWDGGGKSLTVTYPDNEHTTSTFGDSVLTSGTGRLDLLTQRADELGRPAGIFSYDAEGNSKSTTRVGTIDKFEFGFSLNGGGASKTVTIKDPLNSVYTETFEKLNDRWRLVTSTQPAGAGCPQSGQSFQYDGADNLLRKVDTNGVASCYVHDTQRNLETVRVNGLAGTVVCSNVTGAGAALPAGSRKISSQWHPDWFLKTKEAAPGVVTTSVYNGQPDPFKGNATASCAPASALLPDGKPIAVLCKRVEQASTDADGSQGFAAALDTAVPKKTWTYTYNQYGQLLTRKGPRTDVDDTATYTYYADTTTDHTMGDLQKVRNAAGHESRYAKYDKAGRVLQSVDAAGKITDVKYKPRGWVESLTVTPAGGGVAQVTSYEYDAVGLLTKATLPDTSFLVYGYDDAHRLTHVTDQSGNQVVYALDDAGNKTSETVTDASGVLVRKITRVLDALGRVQQVSGAAQ